MKKAILSILSLLTIFSGSCLATADAGRDVLTLPRAVQIAIDNSPAVARSTEQGQQARYAEKAARSEYLPTVSADYTYTALDQAPYLITGGRQVQSAHTTQYQWGVSMVQPLFTGLAVSSRHNIEKLGIAIQDKENEQTVLDITKSVKRAYYRVLLTRKLLAVADETVATLASHEKDAQLFFDRGILRRNDLLRAKVALSNAVQLREGAGADARIAVADLNRWLSFDISADTRIADIDTVQYAPFQLGALIEEGLKTRPQLQAMALVRETLTQAVRLEKSAYYPTVTAVGRYWQNGDSPGADSNDFQNDHNASLVVQATWTLFNGNKTRSKVSRAVSEKRAYDESIREARDIIRLEIKSAYLNLGVARKNVETAEVAVSQAEENLRITQLGYRQEAATATEVLDARTDLTQAKTNYYRALYGYLDALAALERAVGRGTEHVAGPNQNS